MAAQLQVPDQRLIDYWWHGSEQNGPVWWDTVNRFCADCAVCDCPVLIAIQAAKGAKLHLGAKAGSIQAACLFVAEYREADGQVPTRKARAS